MYTYWEIFSHQWIYLAAIFVNFCTTLVVFPAVTALAEPAGGGNGDWEEVYFVPVLCFVVYNVADVIGKAAATHFLWPGLSKDGQWSVLVAACARIAFIPLIMKCNVAPNDRDNDVLFESDAVYGVLVALLGATNGYVGNIASTYAPKSVPRLELQGIAASFSSAMIVCGCGIGAVISNAAVKML